jgi:hypothetical protein
MTSLPRLLQLNRSKENFRLSGGGSSRFPAISPIGGLISSERRQGEACPTVLQSSFTRFQLIAKPTGKPRPGRQQM